MIFLTNILQNIFNMILYHIRNSGCNKESFGQRVLPSYKFEKADVIVSFGTDFLGSLFNKSFEKEYIANRQPKTGKMSRHFQIESNLSLSGANADVRIPVRCEKVKFIAKFI